MTESQADEMRVTFEAALVALRPKLHRYCARVTGSTFDGEEVLQDAFAKAASSISEGARPDNLEAWLVTISHNTAIDFLRRRTREQRLFVNEATEDVADAALSAEDRAVAASNLRAFLALPIVPRSCVILMDVLGYSLEEICEMLHLTMAAVKAALHRGRSRLREAAHAEAVPDVPDLDTAQRALFQLYVERFNARDYDGIRDLLAEEVWLDMVTRTRMKGPAEINAIYLRNYGRAQDWRMALGVVDGRPALIVHDPTNSTSLVAYFVQLEWTGGRVTRIRDFRYARYVTDGAEVHMLP